MNTRFRKKPAEIDAWQITKESYKNGHLKALERVPVLSLFSSPEGDIFVEIETLEGTVVAKEGDWVVKGVEGEYYPCRNSIFLETYEEVVEEKPESNRSRLFTSLFSGWEKGQAIKRGETHCPSCGARLYGPGGECYNCRKIHYFS